MDFFDAHLDLRVRSSQDIDNLVYFGLRGALLTVSRHRQPETATEVLERFESVLVHEVRQLQRRKVQSFVALGVGRDLRPMRAWPEVWRELEDWRHEFPEWTTIGGMSFGGETATPEWLLRENIERALDWDKLLLVEVRGVLLHDATAALLDLCQRCGFPTHRLMIAGVDPSSLRLALEAGARPSLTVGGDGLAPPAAARFLRHYREYVPSLMIGSPPRATLAEVSTLARTLDLVRDGFEEVTLDALRWENAAAPHLELYRSSSGS